MNNHIYKVIKWVENPESVSQEERKENKEEAYTVAKADNAAYVAYAAAHFAADNEQEIATRWVNEYLNITGENKQDYLDAIEQEKVGSKKEAISCYVKEYKGLSVPSGATHYSEDGETITFYRVGAPRVERYSKPLCAADDPWSSCLSNPTNELPKIEEEKVGIKKEPAQEWVDGLPPVGCDCLTLHKGDLVECLYVGKGIGEEYIYQVTSGCHRGEIDRLIGSPRFRPLKTQKEKDREAFELEAFKHFETGMSCHDLVKLLGKAGFTAPKEGE
tara:strand:+ start:529 stop:1350 length:822 start_codon:yes stop_codon:yes gene_type:complete